MMKFKMTISLIWLIIWLSTYASLKGNNERIHILHRTGVLIVADNLIQKYEKEHLLFYENHVKDGEHLEWPALNDKNLSDYCRKYLQHCIPKRNTNGATGIRIKKTVRYVKANTSINNEVVIVQCRVSNKSHINSYYITRAPKPNCVYALKSAGRLTNFTLSIINKYCDFEDKPLETKSQKLKIGDVVGEIHYKTRQPIAKDEYLLDYELKHQELHKREEHNGKCVNWPKVMLHPNLDSYCYKYLGRCVPGRKRENVTSIYKTDILYYWKLKRNRHVRVPTVSCILNDAPKLYYYMTRAPETNCVYALLRYGRNAYAPLVIIFKYCDFEEENDQKVNPNVYSILDKDVIVHTAVKEEKYHSLDTMLLFPRN